MIPPISGQPEFVTTNGRERTANDKCIVMCGIGPEYQEPLHSTRLHCEVNVPEAWRLCYRELPLGCPPHHERMYAFKIWAMQRAIDAGFRYILWMDTSFQPIRSIQPLWEVIEREGWYAGPQGNAMLGEYCSDDFVRDTSSTGNKEDSRNELRSVPLVYSGLFGVDVKSDFGMALWLSWRETQNLGLWNGAHYNATGEPITHVGQKLRGHVSKDASVKGHRHDEAALSWLLWRRGLVPVDRGFLTLESPDGFIGHKVELVVP